MSRKFFLYITLFVALFVMLSMTPFPEWFAFYVTNEFQIGLFRKYTFRHAISAGIGTPPRVQEPVMYSRFAMLRKIREDEKNSMAPNRSQNLSSVNLSSAIPQNMPISATRYDKCEQRFPSALLVGFAKTGTSLFMRLLNMHPEVQAKLGNEVNFFNGNYDRGYDWYKKQLPFSLKDQMTVERSNKYSYLSRVPPRVYSLNQNMHIIFIVSNPVEKIISQYFGEFDPLNPLPLEKHLLLSDNSTLDFGNNWLRSSRYHIHIKRWLYYFDSKYIYVMDGESFVRNPVQELVKIEKFLNIRPYIKERFATLNNTKYIIRQSDNINKAKVCKLGNTKSIVEKRKKRPKVEINQGLLKKLYSFFEDENEELFRLVGKKFNWINRTKTRDK